MKLYPAHFFFSFLLLAAFPPRPAACGPLEIGAPAPDFELERSDGGKTRLSDLRGQVIFIDFWASWCPPCRQTIPIVARLHETVKDRHFATFGINLDQDRELALRFMDQINITYPVLMDPGSEAGAKYNVQAIPSFFIIDAKGVLRKGYRGYYPGLELEWEHEIKALLEERKKSKSWKRFF